MTLVALFVDGENMSASYAAAVVKLAESHGRVDLRRVYGNTTLTKAWADHGGFRLMHTASGKNAADLLLTVEAMEQGLEGHFTTLALASSDGDFSALAQRLRERGLTVLGIGESKTPAVFRHACTTFATLPLLPAQKPKAPDRTPAEPSLLKTDKTSRQILDLLQTNSLDHSMRMTDLAAAMHRTYGTKVSTLPEKTWRAYLIKRPTLFTLDPRGPEACVRLKPGPILN